MISTDKDRSRGTRADAIVFVCIALFAMGLGVRNELWREANHLDEVPEL